jgi:hypothetical protein
MGSTGFHAATALAASCTIRIHTLTGFMTRWIDPCGLITGLLLLLCSTLRAQDLYDVEHSKIYARHLYEDGRYAWAADEYSRIIQVKPNDSLKILFLKAHRMSAQWERSLVSVKKNNA